jgi:hypothetical protein
VNVQLEGPASVRAGSRFSFEVVLTARRAVSSQDSGRLPHSFVHSPMSAMACYTRVC